MYTIPCGDGDSVLRAINTPALTRPELFPLPLGEGKGEGSRA
jgi:hypothetical protein